MVRHRGIRCSTLLAALALTAAGLGCHERPGWQQGVDHWVIALEDAYPYYGNEVLLYLFPDTAKESTYGDLMFVVDSGYYGYGFAMEGRFGGEIDSSSMELDLVLDYPFGYYYASPIDLNMCPFVLHGSIDGDGNFEGEWESNQDVELYLTYCWLWYYETGGAAHGYAE